MISISHLTKIYPGAKKPAVNDLSLTIADGEIFGFIGHNGAGKSTTIKSIVGILDYEGGEILINGINLKEKPLECKKTIAYIPDSPDIYEFMSGIEYLNFICDIFDVDNIRNERIERYATLFEIKDVLADPIKTYSHGMKQKLSIVAALCHEPKVLILDEPFVGLDPKASYQLKKIFKERCANGMSIFFSTHVLEVVEKLCDHVAIIKDGQLVANGKVSEVKGDKSLESIFLELYEENKQ